MNEGARQRRISYRLLLTTLWSSLLVLAVEASGGWASHSLTLLAEALHTLVDSFSALLSLIAVASPQRPLGREIWGHGRTEVAATLMLSAFLGFSGLSLLIVAVEQLAGLSQLGGAATSVRLESPILQFVAAMVILSITLGIYCSYQSRFLNSIALELSTRHFLSDSWLSLVTLTVLLGIWRRQTWLDPIYAVVLLVLVVRSFWRVLQQQLPMLLLPTAIAPEAIAHHIEAIEGVTRCLRIRSRGMVGRQVWVELHLVVHPELTLADEALAEQIEATLRHHYGPLRAQIWIDGYPVVIHERSGLSPDSNWY